MKLSTLEFVDAYLSTTGTSWFEASGVPGPSPLPDSYKADATMLREFCAAESARQHLSEFALTFDNVRYRVSRMQTVSDELFVVRRFPVDVPAFDRLGLVPWSSVLLEPFTGLILVAGAYGSGKTTTASALLSARLAKFGGVGVTIEDPPEMPLEGTHGKGVCFQTATQVGQFGAACRAAARWAPSIIFIGEIRDEEAATEALKAGLNGRVIVGTIHADDIPAALERMHALTAQNTGREAAASMLANGTAAVVYQRLAKTTANRTVVQSSLLYLRDEDMQGAKHIIRSCNWQQLDSEINRQSNRMLIAQRRTA